MLARLFITLAWLSAGTLHVAAQSPAEAILSHRIIAGWTQADGTRLAALELALAPGWKTYWRSPGDAGIPPQFDWRAAQNLKGVQVHWPAPVVFWQSGMRSVGYERRVVLPLSVVPRNLGTDIRLKGRVDLGICSDICVPASITVDALLPAGLQDRNPTIVAALAALPLSEREAGVTRATCRLTPTDTGIRIDAQLTMPPVGTSEEAVIEPPVPGVWVSEASASRKGRDLLVSAEMMGASARPLVIERSRLRITVIGADRAVDIRGCTG